MSMDIICFYQVPKMCFHMCLKYDHDREVGKRFSSFIKFEWLGG